MREKPRGGTFCHVLVLSSTLQICTCTFFDFLLVDSGASWCPSLRCARLCPPRTEAAMPLSVSVRDGHISVSAGFARLADSSTARIRPPLLASRGARPAKKRRGK